MGTRFNHFRWQRWPWAFIAMWAIAEIIKVASSQNRRDFSINPKEGKITQKNRNQASLDLGENGLTSNTVSHDTLLRVYETERRDEQNTATLIVAVTVGSLVYLSGAGILLANDESAKSLPVWILLAIPFPLFALGSYVTFQYAASRLRQSYLIYLEQALSSKTWKENVKVPGFVALHQGLFGSFKPQLAAFALLLMVTLFGHVLAALAITVYSIRAAILEMGWSSIFIWLGILGYGLLWLINIYALVSLMLFTLRKESGAFHVLRSFAIDVELDEQKRWTRQWEEWRDKERRRREKVENS